MSSQINRETADSPSASRPRVGSVAVTGERGTHDGAAASAEVADALVVEDLLVEDVSIDGMCGVY